MCLLFSLTQWIRAGMRTAATFTSLERLPADRMLLPSARELWKHFPDVDVPN